MGNRPKPTKLRLLQGNPGKRAINEYEPQPKSGIPSMPKWLKAFPIAVKEWRRESKDLDKMGILTVADLGILATRCYLSSEIQELARDIKNEGRIISTVIGLDEKGKEILGDSKANPKAIQLKNLITEYRQTGSLLGLDPSSRSKLKADKPKGKSKAELFRARKNADQG